MFLFNHTSVTNPLQHVAVHTNRASDPTNSIEIIKGIRVTQNQQDATRVPKKKVKKS